MEKKGEFLENIEFDDIKSLKEKIAHLGEHL
jgi:hypothetical protein